MKLIRQNKETLFSVGAVILLSLLFCWVRAAHSSESVPWPPKVNEPYPKAAFVQADGSALKMRDLKGQYVVIHYRGMTCPACQNMVRVRNLMWKDPRVTNVDVLLFNNAMKPGTADDAKLWAKMYGLTSEHNELVVGVPEWTHSPALYQISYDMVVGGQLLDRDGVVRASVVNPGGGQKMPQFWPELRAMLDGWLGKKG